MFFCVYLLWFSKSIFIQLVYYFEFMVRLKLPGTSGFFQLSAPYFLDPPLFWPSSGFLNWLNTFFIFSSFEKTNKTEKPEKTREIGLGRTKGSNVGECMVRTKFTHFWQMTKMVFLARFGKQNSVLAKLWRDKNVFLARFGAKNSVLANLLLFVFRHLSLGSFW